MPFSFMSLKRVKCYFASHKIQLYSLELQIFSTGFSFMLNT